MQKDYVVKITEENDKIAYSVESTTVNENVFKCYLHDDLLAGKPQIHIETPQAIYDGPIEYLLNVK